MRGKEAFRGTAARARGAAAPSESGDLGLELGYLADHPRPRWHVHALVAIFATMIGIPLVGAPWSRAPEIGWFENRKLAPEPTFPRSFADWRHYPPALERFVSDRLALRTLLIRIDHAIAVVVFHVSPVPQVMLGSNRWLYFTGEDAHALDRGYRGVPPFSDADVSAFRAELVKRRDYLAARGIAYVVTVVPDKYSVYPEFLPDWVRPVAPRTNLERVEEAMRATDVSFVDLRKALRERKRLERVYYMTDSHWNYFGATVGYDEIMRVVEKALPRLRIAAAYRPSYVPGEDVYSGDLTNMLGLPHWLREDDVAPLGKVLADSGSRCAQPDSDGEASGFESYVYRCANPPAYSALVLRDSMAIPLIPILSENFSRVLYASTQRLDPALLERIKPDIVVEEMVERSMNAVLAFPLTP